VILEMEKTKKKSGAGVAILVVACIVAVFFLLVIGLSLFAGSDDDSGVSGLFQTKNKIGVIEIENAIMSSDKTLKRLRKLSKKKSIKAILIRINSPGGAVAPAQEIYREIGKVKKKKPVVVSMETLGTSAAYYIASNASSVVCSKGTITGSIGVIMMLTEIHKITDKLGLDFTVIKAGKFKDIGSSVRAMTPEERALLEKFAKELHEQFIMDVAAARKGKIDIEKLRKIADGSFFSGETAKQAGLVDKIGNLYDAVDIAKKLANVKGEVELEYPEKTWESYFNLFSGKLSKALADAVTRLSLTQSAPTVH
jgi:protease IV